MKKLLLFLSLFLYSFSCDPYDDTDPEIGISNHTWWDSYTDHLGRNIEHIIQFNYGGSGNEYIRDKGTGREESYYFRWYWQNNYTEILLEYDNDVLYFTNVYVTSTTLTGKIEGVSVHFTIY